MEFQVGQRVIVIKRDPHFGLGDVIPFKQVGVIEIKDYDDYEGEYVYRIKFPHRGLTWNGIAADLKIDSPQSNEEAISLLRRDW